MRIAAAALPAALALAMGLRLAWLVLAVVHGRAPIDNEGAEYARLADNLRTGMGYVGTRGYLNVQNPPLYSMLIALLTPLTGGSEVAGRLISLLAGTLLVVPIYALARAAYGPRAAAYAAFVTAVHPFLVLMSTAVLSETLFVTLAVSGLALLVTTLRTGSTRAAIFTGIAFSAAYLTRQEGIVWAAVAVAIAFGATWWSTRRLGRAVLRALAVALPVTLLSAPYLAIVAHQTGHFAAVNKTSGNWITGQRMVAGMPYEQAAFLLGPQLEPLGPELYDYPFLAPYAGPRSVGEAAAFAAYGASRHARLIFWYLHQPLYGTFAMMALIALGLLAPPWRSRWRYEALFVGFAALVFVTLLANILFEERYLSQLVPFTVLWAGRGAALLAGAVAGGARRLGLERIPPAASVTAAAAATALAVALTIASAERAGSAAAAAAVERDAGAWIARNVPNASVMDEGTAIPYYAHAQRWLPLPWGDSALVLRYIARQRPDVLVLLEPTGSTLPYLDGWMRHGVPDSTARRAAVIRAHDREAVIFLMTAR